MASVMALEGVTSFLRWKDVKNTCKKYLRHSPTIGGDFLSAMAESWKKLKKLKTSNVFSLFIVLESK